jgi:hypothetical protein
MESLDGLGGSRSTGGKCVPGSERNAQRDEAASCGYNTFQPPARPVALLYAHRALARTGYLTGRGASRRRFVSRSFGSKSAARNALISP